MKLTVVNNTTEKINTKRLQKTLDLMVQLLVEKRIRHKKVFAASEEIIFVFLNAQAMKSINHQFRGKNKATDVLSFSSEDPTILGELIFCLPVLKKQAKEQNQTLEQELTYMMIHGLLHLLGYDHEESKSEEKMMFEIQNWCFAQVRQALW